MNDVIKAIDNQKTVDYWTDLYRQGAIRIAAHAILVGLIGEFVGMWRREAFYNLVGEHVSFTCKSKTVVLGADTEPVQVTYYEPQESTSSPIGHLFTAMKSELSSDNLKTDKQVCDFVDDIATTIFANVKKVNWGVVRLVTQNSAFSREMADGGVVGWEYLTRMNQILVARQDVDNKNTFDNQTAHTLDAVERTGGKLNRDESGQVKSARDQVEKLSSDKGGKGSTLPDAQVHKAGDTILRALSGDIKISAQAGFDKLVGDLADAIETYQINQNVSESVDTLVE